MLKKIFKGTLIYSISNLCIKFSAILLLPILTRLLTPHEYGIIGTVMPISSILGTVLSFGFATVQMKKYSFLKDNPKKLGEYIFSINIFAIFISCCFLFIIFSSFGEKLFSLIIDLKKIEMNYIYIVGIVSVFSVFNTLSSVFFRMEERHFKIAFGGIISFFLNFVVTILLIKYYSLGVKGFLLGNLSAAIILFIYNYFEYSKKFCFKFKLTDITYSLKNGLPMIFIELTDKLVDFSDRFILLRFVTLNSIGVYSLAATGSKIMLVFSSAISNSFSPIFYEKIKDNKNNEYITEMLTILYGLIIFIAVGGELFSKNILDHVFPSSYNGVGSYLIYLIPAAVLQFSYFLDYYFHYHEESNYVSFFTLISIVTNVLINILFIPKYGIITAVVSTIISFFIRAMLELYIIKLKYKIKFKYGKLILFTFLMINPIIFKISHMEVSIKAMILKLFYLVLVGIFCLDYSWIKSLKIIWKNYIEKVKYLIKI